MLALHGSSACAPRLLAGCGLCHAGSMDDKTAGRLILAGTPIGNVEDASPRLRRLLADADIIAAEDTRRLHALAARLGVEITGKVVSHHEHNEAERSAGLLASVEAGQTVVVVSDAGMPTVSDPGYRVVTAAIERGLPVTTAPGPSAVTTALAVAGLPTDRFTFEGFAPRKDSERRRTFTDLAQERRTMVFFESPHRVAATLATMSAIWGGDRRAAVCRELTKTYEEVLRDTLQHLAERTGAEQVRGEVVIVVEGAPPPPALSLSELVPAVLARVDGGERLKAAVAELAMRHDVSKRDLYAAAIAARR